MRLLLVSFFIILSYLFASRVNAEDYSTKTLVSALPENIETVIGARNLNETLPGERKSNFNLFFPLLPQAYFQDTEDISPIGSLSSKSVISFVQGFQFLRPNMSSNLRVNTCAIYLLKPGEFQSVKDSLTKQAQKDVDSAQNSIWSFTKEPGPFGGDGAYVCFVNKRLLVFATKKSTVLEIASKLRDKKEIGIFGKWREFQDTDLNSNYFVVRHYQKKQNVFYYSEIDLVFVKDKEVEGFSFVSDSLSWKKSKFKYYSKNPSSFSEYLKSLIKITPLPAGHTFNYKIVSKQSDRITFEFTENPKEFYSLMNCTFPFLFGFVPY